MEDTTIFFALGLASFFAFSIEVFLEKAKTVRAKLIVLLIPVAILGFVFAGDISIAVTSMLNYLFIFLFIKLIRKLHAYDEKKKNNRSP